MGLMLDSSVLIKAERQGQNARQMLTAISRTAGETEIALSVVTLLELAHGAARADTAQRKQKRQQFIQELLTALPSYPVTCAGCPSRRPDRRREPGQRRAPPACRSVDRGYIPGTRLQCGNGQSAPLPAH